MNRRPSVPAGRAAGRTSGGRAADADDAAPTAPSPTGPVTFGSDGPPPVSVAPQGGNAHGELDRFEFEEIRHDRSLEARVGAPPAAAIA